METIEEGQHPVFLEDDVWYSLKSKSLKMRVKLRDLVDDILRKELGLKQKGERK
jgi:hypothetical protein